jgi:hypothetical protein
MAIAQIPLPKPTTFNDVLDYVIKDRQKRQELEQNKLASEQLNQYRMGQLELEKALNPSKIAMNEAYAGQARAQADPRLLQAKLESEQALANQRKNYGQGNTRNTGRMGVLQMEQRDFRELVSRDNPQLNDDPEKVYEASNALMSGNDQLSDGTKLNPISPSAKVLLDSINKRGTTANLINQSASSKQAAAEMPVLDQYINEGVEPYGSTIFGYSPKQLSDMADVNDHKAQERLGKYLAAQMLLYERAALTLKINNLPAGVTIADEIAKRSNQTIKAKFPYMTAEARKIASEITAKALTKALKARQSVDIGATEARSGAKTTTNAAPENNVVDWKIVDGQLVRG